MMAAPASPVHARLTLRSGRDDLATLYPWFESVANRIPLPANALFQIQLVLEEAVSNAAMHGFDAGQTGEIALQVEANPTQVVAILSDHGRPFDPLTDAPAAPPPISLEEAAVGGLGIKLMRKFASALRYRRIGPTNELTMIFDVVGSPDTNHPGNITAGADK
ncbi:MAG TPA: ATP-binding protein [Rhodopila sp.]|nr:ATP-binding protein [Rhodopila sp.]